MRFGGADFGQHGLDLGRDRLVLGAAGGPWAAHVMQFRPVGVESPGKELPPEAANLAEQAGLSVAAGCRQGS